MGVSTALARAARIGLGTLWAVLALAALSEPSAAQVEAKPPAGDAAMIDKGRDLFANYGCGSCHT